MPSKLCLLAAAPLLLAPLAPLAHAGPGMGALEQIIEQQKKRIAELEKENAQLKAQVPTAGAPAATPAAAPSGGEMAPVNWSGKTYTLEKGDNLAKIAKKCAVPVEDLMKLNDIKDPKKLQIGQVLKLPDNAKIPSEQPLVPAATSPGKPGEAKPAAQPEIPKATTATGSEVKPAVAKTSKTMLKLVIIPEQTTFAAVAEKYGTTVDHLNKLNKYSFGPTKVIAGGSELWVPEPQQ